MVSEPRYGYKMSMPEARYGKSGYCYFIADKVTDQVISCWAVGSKVYVEKTAIDSTNKMNAREDKARLQSKSQKTQTMKSSSYGHVSVGSKLRGIERA